MTIEELKKQEQELKKRLEENKKAQNELFLSLFDLEFGLHLDDLVEFDMYGSKRKGIIIGLDAYDFNRINQRLMGVRVHLNLVKKDGSLSARNHTLYSPQNANIKVIANGNRDSINNQN